MRILIVYHFFYPDTVVSARLFSDLAADLAKKEHVVTVYSSNRLIHKNDRLCEYEEWNNVVIKRFSRATFSQSSNIGRVFNSIILQAKWCYRFFFERKQYDTVIIGTDPQFAWMIFPFIKLINHKVKLIHWCFDLYPEAIIASSSWSLKLLSYLITIYAFICYQMCDVFVDIGECMRKRLQKYNKRAKYYTLTPWALKEVDDIPPVDHYLRKELFGNAKIGLLYSGTVGHAHDIRPFIELARECRRQNIDAAFCFAGYGNCFEEQTSIITKDDTNIRLSSFISEEKLEKRLAAADIHLISLKEAWAGIVVPSKFFGSLAMGRPVIFSGPQDSAISKWCDTYSVGVPLNENTIEILKKIENNVSEIESLKRNAFHLYQTKFAKKIMCSRWEHVVTER